tara:strand:- start:7709 stop:8407 length:699 start_codon:yes stop_codon:yes gene_type:complete
MKRDVSNYRKSYLKESLLKKHLSKKPSDLFDKWFNDAKLISKESEINAMTLSTVDKYGQPRGRIVLLKYYSQDKFVFFTNYNSEKAAAIENNPHVSLSFFWEKLERQVIIKGIAKKTSSNLNDKYFKSRPRGSKIGAVVSENQSSAISSKRLLEKRYKMIDKKYNNKQIIRPENWGGYSVLAFEYEFWQGGENRLHDRFRYTLNSKDQLNLLNIHEKRNKMFNSWSVVRLSP